MLKLRTLEGNPDEKSGSLTFINKNETHALYGDSEDTYRFRISLHGDEIEAFSYSPLYREHLPVNEGTETAFSTLQGEEDGVLWHLDKDNNLLGCSVCVTSDTLSGEEEEENWLHYNLDGSLAGYSFPGQSGDYVTLSGSISLDGFGFKGLKMPSFKAIKFKAPKIKAPKLPKFKAPKIKFKAPKIKINTKGISNSVSSIGKGISKSVDSVSKGITNVGNQIGKGVNKYVSNISEGIGKVGEIANQVLDTASSILAPDQGLPPEEEEQPTEEEITDPTQVGYSDADGYTDEDGLYYTNDGTLYQNPQTGEWFNMDGSPYGEEQEKADINESVEIYGDKNEDSFLTELGFDLSSLASSPLVSMGLNTILPGSGMAVSAISQGVSASNAKKKANKQVKKKSLISNLKTLNSLTTAKKQNKTIVVSQPKKAGSVKPPQPQPDTELIKSLKALNTNQEVTTATQPKEDNTKTYLMVGGGVVITGILVYLVTKQR